MEKINIRHDNGKVDFNIEGDINFEDFILLCNTCILAAMSQTVSAYKKALLDSGLTEGSTELDSKIAELKGNVYDFYNINASMLLEKFAPEIEAREDLTVQAILEKEDELINNKYEELKESNKIIPIGNVSAQPLENLIEGN